MAQQQRAWRPEPINVPLQLDRVRFCFDDASPIHVATHDMEREAVAVRVNQGVLKGSGQAGLCSTFWNTSALCFGVGCLTIPYGVKEAGFAVSCAMLVFTGALSFVSVRGLSQARRYVMETTQRPSVTFMDTVGELLGRRWRHAATICVCLSQAGVCISFEIFICTTFAKYFRALSFNGWLAVLQLPLIFFSSLRSMRLLGIVSSMSVLFLMIGLVLASSCMIDDITHDGASEIHAATSLGGAVFLFGIVSLSFGGIGAVGLNVEQSMEKPEYFSSILGAAISIGVLFYCGFGMLGYLAFGNHVEDIIALNFPVDSWLSTTLSLSFCFQVMCGFPVNMYPIWKMIEAVFFGVPTTPSAPSPTNGSPINRERVVHVFPRTMIRTFCVLCMAGLVWLCREKFATLLSLVGSCTCATYLFFVPGLIQLKFVKTWSLAYFIAILQLIVGIVAPVATITTVIMRNLH